MDSLDLKKILENLKPWLERCRITKMKPWVFNNEYFRKKRE